MKAEVMNSGAITLTSETTWENTAFERIVKDIATYSVSGFILGEKSSSITLIPMEMAVKVEPKPTPLEAQAIHVSNYFNLMRKGGVPPELAEQLTKDFQDQLLADYFSTGNGERWH